MNDFSQVGVLLVAHGTVSKLEELPDFLWRIRRGRPASAELVRELRHRYEAIGGSPLLAATERQARMLSACLGCPTFVGMRFSEPGIAAALEAAITAGVARLVVLPMAPFSVRIYSDVVSELAQTLASRGAACPELLEVAPWGTHPGFVSAQAAAIRQHAGDALKDAALLLTAHSLPQAVIRAGDRYAEEVSAAARAIQIELGRELQLAYQSQGADGGQWLGPSLESLLRELALRGTTEVVLSPFGFVAEHVETLYDLDVEASRQCKALGLSLLRVPALGDAEMLVEVLASLTRAALGESTSVPPRVEENGNRLGE